MLKSLLTDTSDRPFAKVSVSHCGELVLQRPAGKRGREGEGEREGEG